MIRIEATTEHNVMKDVWNAQVWATLVRMDQKQLGFIELTPNDEYE